MAYRMNDPEIEQCDFIHVHEEIVKRVTKAMPDEDQLMDLADFFKVFADSTRIKILYAAGVKADAAGKVPQGRKDRVLFAGGQPY